MKSIETGPNMKQIRDFNAIVLGKWIKGKLWKRPQLSVEFMENVKPKYYDLPVTMASWYAVEKGSKIRIEMFLNEKTDLWYPVIK